MALDIVIKHLFINTNIIFCFIFVAKHHISMRKLDFTLLSVASLSVSGLFAQPTNIKPNVVFIYADDIGYGDLGCYGFSAVATPNVDRLAKEGLRLTDMHASSSTSTPSRYSLMTGEYAWRRPGTGVAPGDAAQIVTTDHFTLPQMMQRAGYTTAAIGKWHLGLGKERGKQDWNNIITPGPNQIGFDYSYIMAATADRVPCVYIENGRVVGLNPLDPISVSYSSRFEGEPTGKRNPELLRLHPSHGHDEALINGVSRIGYMRGGKSALWIDENIADTITLKALDFISENRDKPFFLYFATNDVHVPRVPHQRFAGKSGLGARGDALLQFDWSVGEVLNLLDELGLSDNTLVIFSSDNGPVVDDGYSDRAVELLGSHRPSANFRGGKYSNFEAGTRVPALVRWSKHVKPSTVSDAPASQIDFFASFASLAGVDIVKGEAPDSRDQLSVLLGQNTTGREYVIEHASVLSIIKDGWKYTEPCLWPTFDKYTSIELGNAPKGALYNLEADVAEKVNLIEQNPAKAEELKLLLLSERQKVAAAIL